MADGIVQLQSDGAGKKVDTSELTVGANTVERQRMVIADSFASGGLAEVQNTTPGANDYGLTVRMAGTVTLASSSVVPVVKTTAPLSSDPALTVVLSPNGNAFSKLISQTSQSVSEHAVVSFGSSANRTLILQTSSSITNATNNTSIVLYTATTNKTCFVQYVNVSAVLGSYASSANGTNTVNPSVYFGTISVQINGITNITFPVCGDGFFNPYTINFPDPIWVAGNTTFGIIASPALTSSINWYASFGGFEK